MIQELEGADETHRPLTAAHIQHSDDQQPAPRIHTLQK